MNEGDGKTRAGSMISWLSILWEHEGCDWNTITTDIRLSAKWGIQCAIAVKSWSFSYYYLIGGLLINMYSLFSINIIQTTKKKFFKFIKKLALI
jgi:hypothetical protein